MLTRAKKQQLENMSSDSHKLDELLAKMNDMLAAKDRQEAKINDLLDAKNRQESQLGSILNKLESLEINQKKTTEEVNSLKESFKFLDAEVTEVKTSLSEKACRTDVEALRDKIEDLENRSKRNNVVLWGLKEHAEKSKDSIEKFLEEEFFSEHMGLQNIEVMRAHRTKIKQRDASANGPKPRPIHVYLLRYTDKKRILKAAASSLKDNLFCESQVFISDDVSKSVRRERAKLREDHLKHIQQRDGVAFAFIPWTVPAQILYKETTGNSLKSFRIGRE